MLSKLTIVFPIRDVGDPSEREELHQIQPVTRVAQLRRQRARLKIKGGNDLLRFPLSSHMIVWVISEGHNGIDTYLLEYCDLFSWLTLWCVILRDNGFIVLHEYAWKAQENQVKAEHDEKTMLHLILFQFPKNWRSTVGRYLVELSSTC